MARSYRDGKGVEKDLNESIKWYRIGVKNGSGIAKNELFEVLWKMNTANSLSEASELAMNFAAEGNGIAALQLSRCYAEGKGVTKNVDKAVEWALKAVEKDVKESRPQVLDCLLLKNSQESNKLMFEKATKYAQNGDIGSMGRLGKAYRDGIGTEKDQEKAIYWLRKAADKSPYWTNELCETLMKTNDTDLQIEAFKRCSVLAEEGNAGALGKLGEMYINGIGCDKNQEKAIEKFRKAAEKSVHWSNELCDILMKSNDANLQREAFEWCVEYIYTGDPGVMGRIGRMYNQGIGVTQNQKRAEKWYKKAIKSPYWKKEYEKITKK